MPEVSRRFEASPELGESDPRQPHLVPKPKHTKQAQKLCQSSSSTSAGLAAPGLEGSIPSPLRSRNPARGADSGMPADLLWRVEPSPDWPRMVNGRFSLRDETTTRYMTHTDVTAHHDRAGSARTP